LTAEADPAAVRAGLSAARKLNAQGNFEEALAILRPLVGGRTVHADALFLFGLAALGALQAPGIDEDGREALLDEAIAAFHSMLVTRPELIRVRLELGRAFFLKREDSLARRHFEQVLAGKPPAPVALNVSRFLSIMRARKRWSIRVGMALAPDSNIGAASDERTVYILGLRFRQPRYTNVLYSLRIATTTGDDIPRACPNRLAVERLDRDLPRSPRHELCCRKRALSDQPMDRGDVDPEPVRRLLRADCLGTRRGRIELGDAEPFPELADPQRRPGAAVLGPASHPVHRDRKLAVRQATAELAHDLDRIGLAVGRVAGGPPPRNPRLAVATAHPVDRQDRFVGLLVEVDHDFLDQGAGQALLCPRAGRRRVPHRGKIARQIHQRHLIDRGTRRPLGVEPDQTLLDLLDTIERGAPPRLQLPRDMPLGGIDQLVATGRERGFVFGLLKLALDGAPALDRRPVDLLGRLQRRFDRVRRDRVQDPRGDRSVDAQPPIPMQRPGSLEPPRHW